MNKKTNPLKNILQKIKNFYIFLNFVLKKIVSLHLLEKSSVFAILSWLLKIRHFNIYKNNKTLAERRAVLFVNVGCPPAMDNVSPPF